MSDCSYVSRGGLKLEAALDAFGLDVTGFICADLGCNVGGFTDCLLQRGAKQVFAIDTGYGELAWKLRQDDRVIVAERTNAMHIDVQSAIENRQSKIDLVVIDLGWTTQRHAIPAALRWQPAHIITLIKPHYEANDRQKRGKRGIMPEDEAETIVQHVIDAFPTHGVEVINHIRSPIRGGAGKGKRGNVEYLALLRQPRGPTFSHS